MTRSNVGQSTAADPRVVPILIRAAEVRVVEGPDVGLALRIDGPVCSVGTGDLCDLRLTDRSVSRDHLRLSLSEHGVSLRDDGSRNGTWIGDVRVAQATITASTRVRIGSTTLALTLDARPSEVAASTSGRFGGALGTAPVMRVVFALLQRAAPTELTVLLEGESGVGKEVLARAVHAASPRAKGPFVTVDCGAIPAHLVESELFGHTRGSFTGATTDRSGLFAEADGGTIFLDEVGELPLEMQPKLLRVLEQREVRPVGANRSRPVDVRVVAATNRQLSGAVSRGEFREDLMYRLAVVKVTVPPLRDRREDVAVLAKSFLAAATGDERAELPPAILDMLVAYAWPGNVRELRNVVQRFAALGLTDRESLLGAPDAPAGPGLATPELTELPYHEARQVVLDRFDRGYLEAVLTRAGGVVIKAAEQSGIARASFYRMLERLGMKAK